jgi:hypothetical protein
VRLHEQRLSRHAAHGSRRRHKSDMLFTKIRFGYTGQAA